MSLKFKNKKLKKEFRKASYEVRTVAWTASSIANKEFGKDLTVTSIYRPFSSDSVHGLTPCCGVDIRVNGQYNNTTKQVEMGKFKNKTINISEAEIITGKVNERFVYDPDRLNKKVVVFGIMDKENRHWDHFHCQGQYFTKQVIDTEPTKPILLKRKGNIEFDRTIKPEDYVKNNKYNNEINISKWDLLWHNIKTNPVIKAGAKRFGKVASGILTAYVCFRLGLPPEVAAGVVPVYMATEKAANEKAKQQTGKIKDYDWVTLIIILIKKIIGIFTNKKG